MEVKYVILLVGVLSAIYSFAFIILKRRMTRKSEDLGSANSNLVETIIEISKSLNLNANDPENAKIIEAINQVQQQNKELNIKNTALEEVLDIAQEYSRKEGISEYAEVIAELKNKVAEGHTLTPDDRRKLFAKRIRDKRALEKTFNAFQASQKSNSKEQKSGPRD